jgi:hypothetical protein
MKAYQVIGYRLTDLPDGSGEYQRVVTKNVLETFQKKEDAEKFIQIQKSETVQTWLDCQFSETYTPKIYKLLTERFDELEGVESVSYLVENFETHFTLNKKSETIPLTELSLADCHMDFSINEIVIRPTKWVTDLVLEQIEDGGYVAK